MLDELGDGFTEVFRDYGIPAKTLEFRAIRGRLYSRIVPGAGGTPPLVRYSRQRLVDEVEGRGLALEAVREILGAEMVLVFRKGG